MLMFRFILVYLLADLTAKAREEKGGAVEFFLEQPAEPQAEPRCASWWRTPEWEALEKLHELKKVTFLQGDWGGRAAKPTTIGTRERHLQATSRRSSRARTRDGQAEVDDDG